VIVLSYLFYTLVSPGTCVLNFIPSFRKALKVLMGNDLMSKLLCRGVETHSRVA